MLRLIVALIALTFAGAGDADAQQSAVPTTRRDSLYAAALASARSGSPDGRAFEQVIAVDSSYVPAWVKAADYWANGSRAGNERSLFLAEGALRLEGRNREALIRRGIQRVLVHFDWRGGEADLRNAAAQGGADALGHLAVLLAFQNRLIEAELEAQKAIKLDSLNWDANVARRFVLYAQRRSDALMELASSGPRSGRIAALEYALRILALSGQSDSALSIARRNSRMEGTGYDLALIRTGQGSELKKRRAAEADSLRRINPHCLHPCTGSYLEAEEYDRVLDLLEQSVLEGPGWGDLVLGLNVDPILQLLPENSRKASLRRLLRLEK
jgi:hypothetical protein